MDAATMAALAIVMGEAHTAQDELMLDRERAAMQRKARCQKAMQRARRAMRAVLRAVVRAVRQGQIQLAEDLMTAELGSETEEEAEEEEREADPEVEEGETSDEEGHLCAICRRRWQTVFQMPATGRWASLSYDERLVCDACHRLQPPQ